MGARLQQLRGQESALEVEVRELTAAASRASRQQRTLEERAERAVLLAGGG